MKKYFSFPVETAFPAGAEVTLTGQVYGKEQASDYQILYLKNNSIMYQEQCVQEPYILVYDNSKEDVRNGNVLRVSGKLSLFEEERNPGGFSKKKYYQSRKIAANIRSREMTCLEDTVFPIREALSNFRNRWQALLTVYAGERDGGILCAILLGDKAQMDSEIKELYQINGIAHILAISGLHLSFIGLGFYRFVRRMTGSYVVGGTVGITFLGLYILMVGSSVSAVRALIMYVIRVGADISGRVYDAPTAVAVAAAAVICWRPLAFYDVGFQLSFGAICGVIFLYQTLERNELIVKRNKSVTASACLQIATLPIILYHYYEMPVYSIFLNLAVIPLMSVLLAMGLLGSALCVILPDVGSFCLFLCRGILRLFEIFCQVCSELPGYRVITGKPEVMGIIIYYLCLLVVGIAVYGKSVRHVQAGIMAVGVTALILSCPAVNYRGMEATFLDVGQGDGIFIREKEIACLIDGGSSDISKVGQYCIEPFLKARGVSCLDYVFVTHGDSDHISGLKELIMRQDRGISIKCMVFPEKKFWDEELKELCTMAERSGIRTAIIRLGQQITGKNLRIECLGPDDKKIEGTGNEASMILSVSYGELDLLFTGDVEGQGEEILTETLTKEYEILKVAHHGSRNSTGEAFLNKTSPILAVISAGKDNRYGHPHPETMQRLEEKGVFTLCTLKSGAIILKLRGKDVANLKIIQYNKSYEKFE